LTNKKLYTELETKIDNLIEIISKIPTIDILLAMNQETLIVRENYQENVGLNSPFSQFQYLYGLVVSTKKVQDTIPLNNDLWIEIKELLNKIYLQYINIFFLEEYRNKENTSMTLFKKNDISMFAFLEYFNNFMLCYVEQVVDRIKRWFYKYDDVIKKKTNCSVDDFLNFYGFFISIVQTRWEKLQKKYKIINDINKEFDTGSYLSELDYSLKNITLHRKIKKLEKEFNNLCVIEICKIEKRFGKEKTKSFLESFTITEDDYNFKYYTDKNPVATHPIFRINESEILNVNNRFLMNAIYILLNEVMEKSYKKQQFFKTRSIESEDKTLEIFKRLFKKEADYYQNLFEEPNKQFEHDILIIYKKNIFIVEVKSSKKREPLRNPEKAFKRIRDDFNRDNSIQKAYEQALHLKNNLLNNEKTVLFDKNGNKITEIFKKAINKIYIICVTRESFGIIASNLTLLLTKPKKEKYPWCVNIFDLESIVDGFLYKGLKISDFIYYLDKRSDLQKIFIVQDELDIVGYFLCFGDFKDIESKSVDGIFLSPTFCDIFDQIYFEKRGLEYKFEVDKKPYYVDIKKEIEKFKE